MASPSAEDKQARWRGFYERAQGLLRRGRSSLRQLSPDELSSLIDEYQTLIADLARARSLGAPRSTIDQLNRIAVTGHNLLYGQMRERAAPGAGWFGGFAAAVRRNLWAVALAAAVFFLPAAGSYVAVKLHPLLGYDLVSEGFLDFDPAHEENLHSIPGLARPVVSSAIITNNVQVTLLAFGFGLTAGIGTTLLLIFNGVHLGAVAGWMTLAGNERALWGWIMPHGATELLAICLAGAAGYLLAGAILAPGEVRRSTALKRAGRDALVIEIGSMAMLVVAGLIEGFVSPSSIDYNTRLAILGASVAAWAVYFLAAGRRSDGAPAGKKPAA
ncbi:MAG TPA: stage II sporulation protein M [Candidatus Acidoferrales bacterium]|nr:stage II sporulation protein M [Candidatus Acidoferrales bacterium]